MFNQMIYLISQLKTGTTFSITEDWLKLNGINASPTNAKKLGRRFAKVYSNHSCNYLGKKSNNLRIYEKI